MADPRYSPDDYRRKQMDALTGITSVSMGMGASVSTVHSALGTISIVKPSAFDDLRQLIAKEKVKGDTVAIAQMPSYAASSMAWGDSPVTQSVDIKKIYLPLKGFKTNPYDVYGSSAVAECFKLEIINLLDKLSSNKILMSDEITLKDMELTSNIILQEGHNFRSPRWFSWLISKHRSISILFDDNDLKIYENDHNGYAVYINPDKVAVLYSYSNNYLKEHRDMYMMSGHPKFLTPEQFRMQMIIENPNKW